MGTKVHRESGLDLFRLVASLGVIIVHVGFFKSFNSEELSAGIRLSARWAVPFFFILTGYLISAKSSSTRALPPLAKTLFIFIISSALMLPLTILDYGLVGTLGKLFSSSVFLSGSYFHLWYLSSAVVGLLLLLALESQGIKKLLPYFAFFCIFTYLAMGAYNPISESGLRVARHFSSVGFLYIGIQLRNIPPSTKRGLILTLAGFVMQEVESHLINYFLPDKSLLSFQFLFGTLLLSVGLFDLARTIKKQNIINVLGAKHSLAIYIFHPYFIFLFGFLPLTPLISDLLIIPFVFLSTLCFSILISCISPQLYKIINGDLSFFKNRFHS